MQWSYRNIPKRHFSKFLGRKQGPGTRSKTGFFLTPPAEKTTSQGQNSSKKLKEKTQPFGGLSLPYAKLKKKTKIHGIFSSKLKNYQRGGTF